MKTIGKKYTVTFFGPDGEEEFKYGFKEFEKEIISEELYREIKEREDRELSPDLVKHLLS